MLAVAAGLYPFFMVATGTSEAAQPLGWKPQAVRTEVGNSGVGPGQIRLTLDPAGRGVLIWSPGSPLAQDYPLVELRFAQPPASLGLFWRTPDLGGQMAQYWLPGRPSQTVWLRPGGMAHWSDSLLELALVLQGQPGETIVLERVALHPSTPAGEFRAFTGSWLRHAGWDHSSVNKQTGLATGNSALYPVPLAAAVLAASLALYVLYLFFRRRLRDFDWRVGASLFLLCWLALDAVWQGKLLRQLQLTQETFAGRQSMEKLQVGPDAALVTFMSDVQRRVAESEGRVFVASASDYAGMRANYYLYPLNVYWRRNGDELPAVRLLRSGDYVVQVQPSALRYEAGKQLLLTPEGDRVPAQLLGSSGLGALYRVL